MSKSIQQDKKQLNRKYKVIMSLTSKSNRNAKKYRIVFLGDQGVGKTSIIQRYTTDRFDQGYNSTVGIDFNVKDITRNGNYYRLQMWDTAGQERYRSLIPTYLKNAHCVVFVFDITKTKTLENLNEWYKLFTDNQEAPGILVANKLDLVNARKVSKAEGEQFCKNKKLKYTEVSAKSGKKINQLFDTVLDLIAEQEKQTLFQPTNGGTSRNNMMEANEVSYKNPDPNKDKNITLKQSTFRQKVWEKCCNN